MQEIPGECVAKVDIEAGSPVGEYLGAYGRQFAMFVHGFSTEYPVSVHKPFRDYSE